MQGAELPHITIYLDIPGQRAAAYVAMSRVKNDDDYFFGGQYTQEHFVPNNGSTELTPRARHSRQADS